MSGVNWPNTLVESLATGDCVLFIGAGFTKNAVSRGAAVPVTWPQLLSRLLDDIFPRRPGARRSSTASTIAGQIKGGDLLWAAQALESAFGEAGRSADFRNMIAQAVDGPSLSPFEPGVPHQTLLDLDIRTIVTTNYDKVLERLFGHGYKYLTHKSDNIADTVRSGRPVVLKRHGTTDDPPGLILTRLDFAQLRRTGSQALTVVEALTLTRTVLFLGYGLDDPDLHLILENQMLASGAALGHYLLAHERSMTPARRDVLGKAFGVEVIRYQGDHSVGFVEALEELNVQVQAARAARIGV